MAPRSIPSNENASTYIPTASDVTTSGGVWAPTSAKREKLRELKAQLAEDTEQNKLLGDNRTLDDLATNDELLDLYLADGLALVMRFSDEVRLQNTADSEADNDFLQSVLEMFKNRASMQSSELTQTQWDEFLISVAKDLEQRLSTLPPDRCLKNIRDFYVPEASETSSVETTTSDTPVTSSAAGEAINASVQSFAQQTIHRFRLLLALGAAEHLKGSWKVLTATTDQDVDRAAVQGIIVPDAQARRIRLDRAVAVLEAHLQGNCVDRVEALWTLLDRDQDGLLDEVEMVHVCELAIESNRMALRRLFQEALQASPVRASLPSLDSDIATPSEVTPSPLGWRQRRRDAKERKRLTTMFERTLRFHFLDEVEMPHRLRCIYAWANKHHQGNTIDSVLVDESGWTGRKRYVELHPKISLPEFREVQREHFIHLDRVGGEFVKSFREELWIDQGKRRNRKKLIRNCSLFLAAVCSTDFLIGTL
jgi:hypothetical protein